MKYIKLTKNKQAIVDDDDFQKVNIWKWTFHKTGYASRCPTINKKTSFVMMHQYLFKVPKNSQIDHVNGNKLDNRKSNLRSCTASQNSANRKIGKNNTSGYKGVSKRKTRNKWDAMIKINGKTTYLGSYCSKKEAAIAYDNAALKYFGEFANLNFKKGIED